MKYKNVTDKVKPFKVGGRWFNLEPGNTVDLPMGMDLREDGLELVEEEKVEEKVLENAVEKVEDNVVEKVEEKVEEEPKKKQVSGKKSKDSLDLNGDGKIDNKDASLASKVMNHVKSKNKKKKSKKK